MLPAIIIGPREAAADDPNLTGRTLSAVAYLARPAGPSELTRIMFQAYLQSGGRALVHVWDPALDAYTRPATGTWQLNGSTLCLGLGAGTGRLCAEIHVWGPRIAGIGANPYVMLDGDLAAGNTIAAARR